MSDTPQMKESEIGTRLDGEMLTALLGGGGKSKRSSERVKEMQRIVTNKDPSQANKRREKCDAQLAGTGRP